MSRQGTRGRPTAVRLSAPFARVHRILAIIRGEKGILFGRALYSCFSRLDIKLPMAELRLLFVDDDAALRTALGAVLTPHGFSLTAVSRVPEALELISQAKEAGHTFSFLQKPLHPTELVAALRKL